MAGKYNKHKQGGSHLGFLIRMILATVDLQVTSIIPMNFWVKCPFGSGKKVQTDFQDGHHGRNLEFQQFELFFIYKSPRCFLPSFESTGLSVQKKKRKIDFRDGRHLCISDQNDFSYFWSTSHPDASYQFSNQLALWFRKISKKKSVSRLSWISNLNNLSYFKSTGHSNASYQVSSQLAFQFKRRSEK